MSRPNYKDSVAGDKEFPIGERVDTPRPCREETGNAGWRIENPRGITLTTGTYGAGLPLTDNRVFTGWIEPDDKSWIIFLGADGKPLVYYSERDSSGAVVGHRVDLEDKGKKNR